MDRFEYAVGLISLIVGLALADIAVSLHRLLKRRGQVKWDAFSVLATVFFAFQCVAMWYDAWYLRQFAAQMNIWFYLPILLQLFLLFLAASAVLPDEGDDGLDLPAYHERQRPYLWSVTALFFTVYGGFWLYFQINGANRQWLLPNIWQPLLPLACALALIWLRGPRKRLAVLVLLLATQVLAYIDVAF